MFDSPQMQRAGQRPVSWVNIPITRTVNNIMANVVEELKQQQQHEQQQPQQSPKRVRWSEELTQVRDISPRHKSSPFRFVTPHRNRSASPSRSSSSSSSSRPSKSSLSSTQLHCSPQMQKVVFRAVNNNNNESNNNNSVHLEHYRTICCKYKAKASRHHILKSSKNKVCRHLCLMMEAKYCVVGISPKLILVLWLRYSSISAKPNKNVLLLLIKSE